MNRIRINEIKKAIESNQNEGSISPKHGDLRVWWCPQVPMKSFHVSVANKQEAKLILKVLAYYDIFQYENNVKGDYRNDGGLSVFDENENDWFEWDCMDCGNYINSCECEDNK